MRGVCEYRYYDVMFLPSSSNKQRLPRGLNEQQLLSLSSLIPLNNHHIKPKRSGFVVDTIILASSSAMTLNAATTITTEIR